MAGLTTDVCLATAQDQPTIAVLSSHDSAPFNKLETSFRNKLAGRYPNAKFSHSLFSKDLGSNREIVKRIRREHPQLILALGTSAVREATQEFPDTPVIASMVVDDDAFADSSMATGIVLKIPPHSHLRFLRRFLPDIKRVAIIYDPEENQDWVYDATSAAGQYDFEIVPIKVESPRDLPRALKQLSREGEVLLGIPDTTVYSGKTAKMVLLSSFRNKIPFIGLSRSWVKAGSIYGLEWDYGALGRECGDAALKILGGASPTDIQNREMNENLLYSVNMKTLKHFNLKIDKALLNGAAKVFE